MKLTKITILSFYWSCIFLIFFQITSCKSINGDYHIQLVLADDGNQNLTLEESQAISPILRQRLKVYGYYDPNFSIQASGNQLLVEVRYADDPLRLKRLLATRGNLSFAAVHNIKNRLSRIKGLYQGLMQEASDDLLKDAFGLVAAADTSKLFHYLNNPAIKALYPKGTRFVLSAKPLSNTTNYLVYALDYHHNDVILNANFWLEKVYAASADQSENEAVLVVKIGEEKLAQWQKFMRRKKDLSLAFLLDERVYSTFSTDKDAIFNGQITLTGSFSKESAQDLADILKVDPLPCGLLIQDEHIKPVLRE